MRVEISIDCIDDTGRLPHGQIIEWQVNGEQSRDARLRMVADVIVNALKENWTKKRDGTHLDGIREDRQPDAPPTTVDWSGCDLVEAIPGKVSGAWCLKHSRMPVQIIVDHYDRGWSPERISTGWEGITLEQVKGVIAYARPPKPDAPPTHGEPS